MKKKIIGIIDRNLNFIIVTFFSLLMSINQLKTALFVIRDGGKLNDLKYSIIMLKLDITNGDYQHIYEVGNYALVPILIGVIYNIFIRIRTYIDKEDSGLK